MRHQTPKERSGTGARSAVREHAGDHPVTTDIRTERASAGDLPDDTGQGEYWRKLKADRQAAWGCQAGIGDIFAAGNPYLWSLNQFKMPRASLISLDDAPCRLALHRVRRLGAAAGLLFGGVLTSELSWRWCLYVNIAFALAALIGAPRVLPALPGRCEVRIDVISALAATTGMAARLCGGPPERVGG